MDINDLRSTITVLVFVLFIGIVFWTYSSARKSQFDEAARLVDEDDDTVPPAGNAGQQHN